MKFTYLSAYKVQGISASSEDPDTLLLDRPDLNMQATLTGNVHGYLYHRDRALALATLMLGGEINSDNLDQLVEANVEEIHRERARQLGADSALVIEIGGKVETDEEPIREFEDFDIYFDVVDRDTLEGQYRHIITASVSALCIASDGHYKTEQLATGIQIVDADGKTVYSYSGSVGDITAYVSRQLDALTVASTKRYAELLIGKKDLERVSKLLAQAVDARADRFRRFIDGWTALEIFISKVFSYYEQTFIDTLVSESNMTGAKRYFERINEVMKSRYRLVDKFSVIVAILADEDGFTDVEEFKRVKRIRDNVLHGEDIPETTLPTDELQMLVSKYLQKHLDRISSR